jgi:hypothetical protein
VGVTSPQHRDADGCEQRQTAFSKQLVSPFADGYRRHDPHSIDLQARQAHLLSLACFSDFSREFRNNCRFFL